MSKDSVSSRIPRLDGVTRIPLPGNIRPMSATNVAVSSIGPATRPAQVIRAPTVTCPLKRPSTLGGSRPPVTRNVNANALKRSSSGDHIANAVSLVSRKTTNVFKKLIGKPEKSTAFNRPSSANQIQLADKRKTGKPLLVSSATAENVNTAATMTTVGMTVTPRPLTRSDTFVRSADSPSNSPVADANIVDITQFAPSVLTQSTPACVPTRITRQSKDSNETTKLLNANTRHALYTTQNVNDIIKLGETFEKGIAKVSQRRTISLDATRILSPPKATQDKDSNRPLAARSTPNATHTILKPNLTATFNAPQLLGQTLHVISPKERAPSPVKGDCTLFLQTKVSDGHTKIVDSVDAISPVTNATYSEPGSLENLQLLEDISVPSYFDLDVTLQPEAAADLDDLNKTRENLLDTSMDDVNATIRVLAPDKAHMKLPLNSTINTERLLDLSATMFSPAKQMRMFNLTKDYLDAQLCTEPSKNNSQLLYMTQQYIPYVNSTHNTLDCQLKHDVDGYKRKSDLTKHLLDVSQLPLKATQSDLVLPTRTPEDEEQLSEPMEVDTAALVNVGAHTEHFCSLGGNGQQQLSMAGLATSLQDVSNPNAKAQKSRFSFGLDLTESTLDCSIELVDVSLSSTALSQRNANSSLALASNSTGMPQSPCSQAQQMQQQFLRKQNSFDLDESLGILTPDQMKEFLDSTNTNNTNNMDLPLAGCNNNNNNKMTLHQLRIDQTPSPEDLPLDPVEVKTDITDIVMAQHQQQQAAFNAATMQQQRQQLLHKEHQQQLQCSSISTAEPVSAHTDTELSKTSDQMSKSNVSKISTSFITSVTSVTSLDTGYQGDGEMSRPASRGACDHSPSNGPASRKGGHVSRQPSFNQQQQQMQLVRRQDPMTDSDFFTESDADDIFHRGDRRAQVIDGQLYGPMLQPAASVFISEDPEDSCMESSGIFTDVENRCDEDLVQMRRQDTQEAMTDMSPEGDGDDSTETVKSNREGGRRTQKSESASAVMSAMQSSVDLGTAATTTIAATGSALGQGQLSSSQTSSTLHSSISTDDRLSAATLSNRTSYCSVDGSTVNMECKSFSSLEEAFVECCTALNTHNNAIVNANATANGSTSTSTSISGVSIATTTSAKRSRNSATGNSVADSSGVCASVSGAADELAPPPTATVQRVTPPRKHASLNSLALTTDAVHGADGAKTEIRPSPYTANERESRSESGTLGIKLTTASFSSNSSTSLSFTPADKRFARNVKINTSNFVNNKTNIKNLSKNATYADGNGVSGVTGNAPPSARKKQTPNKWEAVMNKIESNKLLPKKNYNDVKSKVSTIRPNGISANASCNGTANRSSASTPAVRRSPTNVAPHSGGQVSPRIAALLSSRPTDNGSHNGGSASQITKRLLQGAAAKRGRSYSKDSQKSSQSDLSMASAGTGTGGGSGSPKLLAKTPLRAAKKRDVRNLSISPTDLGPPPKAQQTAKGTSTRNKPVAISLTQKRYNPQNASGTPSATSTAVSTPTSAAGVTIKLKGKSTTEAAPVKTPLKDHNRIIGSSQSIAVTSTGKNGSKGETPTEMHEIHHNNNNITTTTTATNGTTRTSSQTSSPILGHHGKKGVTAIAATAAVASTTIHEKKTQSKLLQTTRGKTLSQKHQLQSHEEAIPSPSAAATTMLPTAAAAEQLDAAELQRLKLLNRHSCNGRLDYEALKRHLEQTERRQQQQDKSVEALGVLVQYLVYDLDAFACPTVKTEKLKIHESLTKTVKLLDEAKSTCTQLQDQLCDKEAYYTEREEELQALHRCELQKAQSNLSDYKQKLDSLQIQLVTKDEEHKRSLDAYRLELDNKLMQRQQQLAAAEERENELKQRLGALEISEQDLRNKMSSAENIYAMRLNEVAQHENELNERIKSLTKELDTLRTSKEHRERELRDKLNLSQDEIAVLRSSQKSYSENFERSSTSSPRNSSTSELARLQSEADSLHCVLELKQKEISKLTKRNEELLRDAEERVTLQGKVSLLESSNEMLRSELEIKSEKEKDFQRQIEDMQKAYNHEMMKRTRLSYDNEALQWQLKQRSEQLHIVESKLQELSAQESFITKQNSTSLVSLNRSQQLNGSSLANMQMEDMSPPTSPVIKGVIEKPDSVSWVLEMDDETPEVAASKMVRRAGSFRSVERSPSTRRQLSGCASAITTSLNCGSSTQTSGTPAGPNPLSQSMSATSVIRQHSSDVRHEFGNRTHPRIRSKSVSVKSTEPGAISTTASTGSVGTKSGKKLLRQSSSTSARKQHQLELINWKEPMSASSPYGDAIRPRTSTMCTTQEGGEHDSEHENVTAKNEDGRFQRAIQTRKLITCDASTLNMGERLDLHALPPHPSVHDLKVLKKCQEIQESAGEAMVSGTNSEDEGCSASSDEIVCSASSSSGTTGSTSSLNQLKHTHMSLEEALLLDKINSLNGTPMEVSWSDDVDVFANGSTV